MLKVILALLVLSQVASAEPFNSKRSNPRPEQLSPDRLDHSRTSTKHQEPIHREQHESYGEALITYYWPGEAGGRYDRDGERLHDGVAAVDYRVIPFGRHFHLTGHGRCLDLVAKDCGGSAVLSKKAARQRGLSVSCVVDVWVSSQREAMERESEWPSVMHIEL